MCQELRLSVSSVVILQTADVTYVSIHTGGRNSSLGTATRYGMDDPGFESGWVARFSESVHTGPGAHPASYTGSLSRGQSGRVVALTTHHLLVPRLKKE
jgi:hypothetical protein